jgi:hypothetical protein
MTELLTRRAALTSLLAATVSVAGLAAVVRADAPGGFDKAPPKSPGQGPGRPAGTRPNGLKSFLAPSDRDMNSKCINKTLTEAPTGKTWNWSNPKTGNKGSVTPTNKAQRHNGQTCRTFRETITLKDGRSETVDSKACRNADGGWTISG